MFQCFWTVLDRIQASENCEVEVVPPWSRMLVCSRSSVLVVSYCLAERVV